MTQIINNDGNMVTMITDFSSVAKEIWVILTQIRLARWAHRIEF